MARLSIELRPCYIKNYKTGNEEKALFHGWTHESRVKPGMLIGETGGQVESTFGIVEDENGSVLMVDPNDIRFCDHKIWEYAF